MKSNLPVAAAVLMALVGLAHFWCALDPDQWFKQVADDQPGLLGVLGGGWTMNGLLVALGVVFLALAGVTLLIHPRVTPKLPGRSVRVLRVAGWVAGGAWLMFMVGFVPVVLRAAAVHPADGMVWGAVAGLAFCPVWFAALWHTRASPPR